MLPVDPRTGGIARMMGWYLNGAAATQNDGSITITGDTDLIHTSQFSPTVSAWQSPMPVRSGSAYTAAVDIEGAGNVLIFWVSPSGITLGTVVDDGADGRISVTAVAPPSALGAVMGVQNAGDPATFRNPVFVQSTADPGPLPPLPDPLLVGDRLYGSLPEMYRTADTTAAGPGQTPLPLYQLLHAIGEQADWPLYYADRMAARELTDPDLADDAWIPWLAQASGISQSTSTTAVADMRAGIAGKQQAAQPGTPAAIIALVRTWLTGSKVCNIVPTSTAWTIAVQVRADEMNGMTATQLKDRILATGLVPAGFTLNISNALPTWGQIDAAFGSTWGAKDTNFPLWQDIDSYGVT